VADPLDYALAGILGGMMYSETFQKLVNRSGCKINLEKDTGRKIKKEEP
jgi:hypothetical protein